MCSDRNISVHIQSSSAPTEKHELAPPRHGVAPPEPVLSDQQQKALALITEGRTYSDVAEAAGVDRGTLYRWRHCDANFIAALNQWRATLTKHLRDQVLALADSATKTVANAVDHGNGNLGLRVMDKMGILKPGATAPTDPYAVFGVDQADQQERQVIVDGFTQLQRIMNDDQRRRAHQLLAVALVIDFRRRGGEAPRFVQEMAHMTQPTEPAPAENPPLIEVSTTETPSTPRAKSWSGARCVPRLQIKAVIYDARRAPQAARTIHRQK